MTEHTERVPVESALGDFHVEVVSLGGEEEVASAAALTSDLTQSVRAATAAVAEAVGSGLEALRPEKVMVEFGCEVGLESGKLTAVLVKGTAKANIKVTLEWMPGRPDEQGT